MSAVEVTIEYENGYEETIERPARKTTDGYLAIKYRGEFFLVRSDFVVIYGDNSDDWVVEEAPYFFQSNESFVFSPTVDPSISKAKSNGQVSLPASYHFEKSDNGHLTYFAFDGNDNYASRVTELFELQNLGVKNTVAKPSFKPAKNGVLYDFYIRVKNDLKLGDIEAAFKAPPVSEIEEKNESISPALRAAIVEATQRIRDLVDEKRKLQSQLKQLSAELADSKSAKHAAERRLKSLEEKKAAAAKTSDQSEIQISGLIEENSRLRDQVEELKYESEFAKLNLEETEQELAALQKRLVQSNTPRSDSPLSEEGEVSGGTRRAIEKLLRSLYPRVCLNSKSIKLLNKIGFQGDILTALAEIEANRANHEKIKGTNAKIYEYRGLTHGHLSLDSNTADKQGRLYFKIVSDNEIHAIFFKKQGKKDEELAILSLA
jgi:hypothetical protein